MTDLPPLPEPDAWKTTTGPWGDISTEYAYSPNAMREYAKQAVEAEREACAKMCDAAANDDTEDDAWNACGYYLSVVIRARR